MADSRVKNSGLPNEMYSQFPVLPQLPGFMVKVIVQQQRDQRNDTLQGLEQ